VQVAAREGAVRVQAAVEAQLAVAAVTAEAVAAMAEVEVTAEAVAAMAEVEVTAEAVAAMVEVEVTAEAVAAMVEVEVTAEAVAAMVEVEVTAEAVAAMEEEGEQSSCRAPPSLTQCSLELHNFLIGEGWILLRANPSPPATLQAVPQATTLGAARCDEAVLHFVSGLPSWWINDDRDVRHLGH